MSMTTTYYERGETLFKLEVDTNVLDYKWDGGWKPANDVLTGWIIDGDAQLDKLDAVKAEAQYPSSTTRD